VALYRPLETVLAAGRPTVGALFRGRVAVNPDHRAVVDGDRVMTYRRLEERSNRLANAMTDRGLDPGDRVGLLARNCAEYVEVELNAT
jgi:acyl-CoA synthetase (AMP-forming)/AMP-acid ligase II